MRPITIHPHQCHPILTGLQMSPPSDTYIHVAPPRSRGLALHHQEASSNQITVVPSVPSFSMLHPAHSLFVLEAHGLLNSSLNKLPFPLPLGIVRDTPLRPLFRNDRGFGSSDSHSFDSTSDSPLVVSIPPNLPPLIPPSQSLHHDASSSNYLH
jgi:hypothetical protein